MKITLIEYTIFKYYFLFNLQIWSNEASHYGVSALCDGIGVSQKLLLAEGIIP